MSRKQINQQSSKTNADGDTLGGRTAAGPRLGSGRWAEAGLEDPDGQESSVGAIWGL